MRIAALVFSRLLLFAAPAAARPTAIVAMGDSFISGEGGRWLGNGSEPLGTRSGTDRAAHDCGRSAANTTRRGSTGRARRTAATAPTWRRSRAPRSPSTEGEPGLLGSDGARSLAGERRWHRHFGEPPQADQLAALRARDQVRMVVVTVGANDVGFGELVAGCALDWARSPEDEPDTCQAKPRRRSRDACRGRPARDRGVARRAPDAAGGRLRRSDYRLVAIGYASPFPEGAGSAIPEDGWSRLTKAAAPSGTSTPMGRRGHVDIDGILEVAAAASGAAYLDLTPRLRRPPALRSRSRASAPAGPSPLTAEWFHHSPSSAPRGSLHPNAYGQQVIGACLGLLLCLRGDYACATPPASTSPASTWRPMVR